jgi:uncharacterized tellurite resistance protein B-like protein
MQPIQELDRADRLQLLDFVCSFAWADLRIRPQEREFMKRLIGRLELPPDERSAVDTMLSRPPRPEDVDPIDVPLEHRRVFLQTVRQMVLADGEIDPAEADQLDLFEELLGM